MTKDTGGWVSGTCGLGDAAVTPQVHLSERELDALVAAGRQELRRAENDGAWWHPAPDRWATRAATRLLDMGMIEQVPGAISYLQYVRNGVPFTVWRTTNLGNATIGAYGLTSWVTRGESSR